jgi:hypothetical protein
VGCALTSLGNECSHPPRWWCWPCLSEKWKPSSGMVGFPGPSHVGEREEWAGWYCGPICCVRRGGVTSTLWITSKISILCWWPLLFSLEWWVLCSVWGACLANLLPLEGTDCIQIFGAVICELWYHDIFSPVKHGGITGIANQKGRA